MTSVSLSLSKNLRPPAEIKSLAKTKGLSYLCAQNQKRTKLGISRKNKPLLERLVIEDVAAEGKAMGKVNDIVVFVPFAAPGDVVDVQVTKKRKKYYEGRPVHFHHLSENRAEPFCEHFGTCGGCKWQHLPYEKQLTFKQNEVMNNLRRIGKVELPEPSPNTQIIFIK